MLLRVCWWIKAALTDDLWQRVAAAVGAERGFVPPPLTPFNPDIQTRTRAVNTFTHTQPMFLTLCSLILLRLLLRSDLRGWNWTSLGRSLARSQIETFFVCVFCFCFLVFFCLYVFWFCSLLLLLLELLGGSGGDEPPARRWCHDLPHLWPLCVCLTL